jgi:hypothetical protein
MNVIAFAVHLHQLRFKVSADLGENMSQVFDSLAYQRFCKAVPRYELIRHWVRRRAKKLRAASEFTGLGSAINNHSRQTARWYI